jgi:hypothetical protein
MSEAQGTQRQANGVTTTSSRVRIITWTHEEKRQGNGLMEVKLEQLEYRQQAIQKDNRRGNR